MTSRVITAALREARRNVALGKLTAFETEAIGLGALAQCEPSAKQAVVGGLIEIAEANSLPRIHGRELIEELVTNGLRPSPPLVPEKIPRPYRTPQSTVDAFWYVARSEPDKLSQWLADHKRDAPCLRELLKSKEGAR